MVQVESFSSHYLMNYEGLKKDDRRYSDRLILIAYLIRVKVLRFTLQFSYLQISFLKFILHTNL